MTDYTSPEAGFVVGEIAQVIEIPNANVARRLWVAERFAAAGVVELAFGKVLGSNGEVTSMPDLVREVYTGLGWAALGVAALNLAVAATERLQQS